MKKTLNIVMTFPLLLVLFVSCGNGPSQKQIKEIKEKVKLTLAHFEMIDRCFNDTYIEMLEQNDEIITAGEYEGREFDPMVIIADRVDGIKDALNLLIEKPDISTARAEIEDGTKMSQLADELIKKAERINVDLSEFVPVQSSDNISMWAFTEKNSGIEFYASCNNNCIILDLSEDSKSEIADNVHEQIDKILTLHHFSHQSKYEVLPEGECEPEEVFIELPEEELPPPPPKHSSNNTKYY